MEPIENKKQEHTALWKEARWGVIIFCIIHFLFGAFTGNNKIAAPVFINYLVSAWYIKRQIAQDKTMQNLLVMGLCVSGVIFLIQLVLGILFVQIATK